jgi:DNA repair photolyase
VVREVVVKSVLNKKKHRDSWFLDDYTLNPFEGCSFNCQYCYVRGSKYGENMAEHLSVKTNALEVLDKQLAFRVKKKQYGIIALASATDPYLGIEEQLNITRECLQLIAKHRFPVLIITKSDLVLRDISILKEINEKAIQASDLSDKVSNGVTISFSLSTLDKGIASTLEPGAPLPITRLETMMKMKEAGFKVGVNAIPTLPFISDSNECIENMVLMAKSYRADYILFGGLTLFGTGPADSKTLYYKFLQRSFPELIPGYNRLYKDFFMPQKKYLKDLEVRSNVICQKHGLSNRILSSH